MQGTDFCVRSSYSRIGIPKSIRSSNRVVQTMLFLSIHPRHVQAIVEGRKTVELRKRAPRIAAGSQLVIYATTPRCEVVATALVERIEVSTPRELWPNVAKLASVSEHEFKMYYQDVKQAVAIHLAQVNVMEVPIPLSDLRKSWQHFHPPQQYRYLDESQQRTITCRKTHAILVDA